MLDETIPDGAVDDTMPEAAADKKLAGEPAATDRGRATRQDFALQSWPLSGNEGFKVQEIQGDTVLVAWRYRPTHSVRAANLVKLPSARKKLSVGSARIQELATPSTKEFHQ